MNSIGKRERKIINQLRGNARQNLTNMSKETQIPVSTIFEKIKKLETNVILRHTALLNFGTLGYNLATVMLKCGKNKKDKIEIFLRNNEQVNSLMKINNGFDYMVEAVFSNMLELEGFLDQLEERFGVKKTNVHYVTKEIKREGYLADSLLV